MLDVPTPLAEYAAVLRLDFCSFLDRCFLELNPQTPFLMNWHVEVMASKLDAVRRGEIKRLIINVPPRHLKSICASVALPAWCLGHDPSKQIICASYAQDLSEKLARDCRAIVASAWYRKLFRTRLSPVKQSVQEFATTGYRLATSVGGVLTGRGADLVIIDDPLKPDEAASEARRRSANEWFDHTLYSRLNSKRDGAIILIMQRLHEDDLVGHVLEQEDWEVVRFPAIAEEDEVHAIDTPHGPRRFTRKIGDPLHPEREGLETIERIRKTLGEYNFAGQYQQSPAPQGGGMVKLAWFKTYTPAERSGFRRFVQSWDTANKPSELSDYSVCTTWGLKDKSAYLLDVVRKRMDYPELKHTVREQHRLHNANVILIEDKASGTQLIQELVREGLHGVQRYKPEFDKVMRMHAQTSTIENGFVYLPDKAPWLAVYQHELTGFPMAKHDDQVNSTSQFLDWFKTYSAGPSMRWTYINWIER